MPVAFMILSIGVPIDKRFLATSTRGFGTTFGTTFNKAFGTTFGVTFNTPLAKSFSKAFGFCSIQRVFDIAIGSFF